MRLLRFLVADLPFVALFAEAMTTSGEKMGLTHDNARNSQYRH